MHHFGTECWLWGRLCFCGVRGYIGTFSLILMWTSVQFSSFHSVVSNSLQPHESQHARPPCLSPTPGVYPNPCPSSLWCHPAISSSVIPFSFCPQSFPALESFPMSQLFTWDGQSIGVSALASFLPMNTRDWFPLEWTNNRLVANRKRSTSSLYIVTLLI